MTKNTLDVIIERRKLENTQMKAKIKPILVPFSRGRRGHFLGHSLQGCQLPRSSWSAPWSPWWRCRNRGTRRRQPGCKSRPGHHRTSSPWCRRWTWHHLQYNDHSCSIQSYYEQTSMTMDIMAFVVIMQYVSADSKLIALSKLKMLYIVVAFISKARLRFRLKSFMFIKQKLCTCIRCHKS